MLTTASVRKSFIPKQILEINTFLNQQMSMSDRLQGSFREIVTGDQFSAYHQGESQAQATLRLEGTEPDEMRVVDGYSLRVYKKTWALRLKWTKEVRQYKQLDLMAEGTTAMKRAPQNTVVALCVATLQLGNSTSGIPVIGGFPLVSTLSMDGNPIFYAAHTYLNNPGITNSNYLSTGSVDETGIDTLTDVPFYWKDPNNAPLMGRVTKVLGPPQQRHNLYRVLGSEWTPDSGNNAINTVGADLGARDYAILNDLTLPNTVYGQTSGATTMPATINWGWKPQVTQAKDVLIDADMVTTDFSLSVEIPDYTAMIRMGAS